MDEKKPFFTVASALALVSLYSSLLSSMTARLVPLLSSEKGLAFMGGAVCLAGPGFDFALTFSVRYSVYRSSIRLLMYVLGAADRIFLL